MEMTVEGNILKGGGDHHQRTPRPALTASLDRLRQPAGAQHHTVAALPLDRVRRFLPTPGDRDLGPCRHIGERQGLTGAAQGHPVAIDANRFHQTHGLRRQCRVVVNRILRHQTRRLGRNPAGCGSDERGQALADFVAQLVVRQLRQLLRGIFRVKIEL